MSYLQDLLDVGRGASNSVASTVTAPVDGIAWLLRKAGIDVGTPIGGSDWMRANGLIVDPVNKNAGLLGETAGAVLPILAGAYGSKIAKGLLDMGENAAVPAAAGFNASQRGAIDLGNAAKAQRMSEMGMERGWYRGGPEIVGDKRSGPWYTQIKEEAADYAKRFSPKEEVREYAIPASGYLSAGNSYSSQLAHDLASVVEDKYFGPAGQNLAKELRTYGPNDRVPGYEVWQALESRFGNDGAGEALQRLGPFKGVRGVAGPHDAFVFSNAPVRDAQKAAFDPAKIFDDNILSSISTMGLLGGAPFVLDKTD